MRTHSPLVLDVRELLEHHGVQRQIAFDSPVEGLRAGLVEVADPIHLELTLEAVEGGVVVRGALSGSYTGQCRRCLKAVSTPFRYEGAEIYRPTGDVWEEGYVIKDATIDLDPMVRDTVGLNLPTSPLCRRDCAGLCSRCGADLNEGQCDCPPDGVATLHPEEGDLRWAALKELARGLPLEPGNGVPPEAGNRTETS